MSFLLSSGLGSPSVNNSYGCSGCSSGQLRKCAYPNDSITAALYDPSIKVSFKPIVTSEWLQAKSQNKIKPTGFKPVQYNLNPKAFGVL